jgi:hypothetical protein
MADHCESDNEPLDSVDSREIKQQHLPLASEEIQNNSTHNKHKL